MLGLLVKKQLSEIFKEYFVNSKKNVKRSKLSVCLMFFIFALVVVGFIGGMNAFLSDVICAAFCSIDLTWLYFSIFALLSILLGVFGSVFSTYSGLYLAKDNDLLLSMPIPVGYIVISRIINVYLMGALYSAVAFIPCVIVYFIKMGFSFPVLVGCTVMLVEVTVIVLVLSCLLGWAVAKISKKLKNKSFITVIISLVFIAVYYVFYFKAQEILSNVIENAAKYGKIIKESAGIIYFFGKCGEGDALAVAVSVAVSVILPVITIFVLSKTFLKLAISTGGQKKKVYVEKAEKQSSVVLALFKKELAGFTSSANYMLNCGLGVLLLPAAGIFMLIKGQSYLGSLVASLSLENGVISVVVVAIICLLASMNDMAAPSVSLEGRSLWLTQSLPVSMWCILRAKILLQLVFTLPAVLFCGVCILTAFRLNTISNILIIAVSLAFTVFNSFFGMFLGVKMPNFTWTNEIKPIKQSACVFIALFGAFLYSAAIGGGYFVFRKYLSSEAYLAIVLGITLTLSLILYSYLKTKGTKKFESF